METLRSGERSAGEIERTLGAPQPTVSKHLKALRMAGLVRMRKDAQRRLYSLDPEPLAELDAWLAQYRGLWEARLDRFGAALLERQEKHRNTGKEKRK